MNRNENYFKYKCYLNCNNKKMKLCGIYDKKNKYYFRILGHNNLIYTIIVHDNGDFSCSCPYYKENNIKICKHLFYMFFYMFKIFKIWYSYESKIYLNRYVDRKCIQYDESFLNGKLNDVSFLLFRKKMRSLHFKLLDQTLFEIDNFYLKVKHDKSIFLKKYNSNQDNFCNICFENKEAKFKCPNCKKTYDLECINKWVKINASCPSCRFNINDYKKILNLSEMIYHKI